MKKFILLLVLPLAISAQTVLADFVVLNEGADADYHKLEKVWKVHHQKAIDAGHKLHGVSGKEHPQQRMVKMLLIMLFSTNLLQ